MPKKKLPGYLLHKATGQAQVVIHGKSIYLGKYNSPESKEKYDNIIREYLENDRKAPPVYNDNGECSIAELSVLFMEHATSHYKKHGRSTETDVKYRLSLEPVVQYYGDKPISSFGPLALDFIRNKMIECGTLCRTTINDRINCIRSVFKWAVSQELCEPKIYDALCTLRRLEKGRCEVRESEPVEPVPEEIVDQTLPYLSPIIQDMIRVQLLSACRPGEVCVMRACDLDRREDVWVYSPNEFKLEHLEIDRKIAIGPKCQEVLKKYLEKNAVEPEKYFFSPKDTYEYFKEQKRQRRKSKVQPSQIDRSKENPKRGPGEKYTTDSYRRAISRACEANGIEVWSPNQLRHTKGTEVRDLFGIEGASATLGHSNLNTTEIYADTRLKQSKDIAKKIG